MPKLTPIPASQPHKPPASASAIPFTPRSNAPYPVIRNYPRPGCPPPPELAETVPLGQSFMLETAVGPRAAREGTVCTENPIINFRYVEDDVREGWYFEEFKHGEQVLTRLELCKAWALAVNGARYWEKFAKIAPTDEVMRIQCALAIKETERCRAYQVELSIVLNTLTQWQASHHTPASWAPLADEIAASPDWYLQRGSCLQPNTHYRELTALFITIAKYILRFDQRFEHDPVWVDENLPVLEVEWYEWPKGFPVGGWETVFPKEARWAGREKALAEGDKRAGAGVSVSGQAKTDKKKATRSSQVMPDAATIRAPRAPPSSPQPPAATLRQPAKPTETYLSGFTDRPEAKRILRAYVANMAHERHFEPMSEPDIKPAVVKPTAKLTRNPTPTQHPAPPTPPTSPARAPTALNVESDAGPGQLHAHRVQLNPQKQSYLDVHTEVGSVFSSWTARVPLPPVGVQRATREDGELTDAQAYAAVHPLPRVRGGSSGTSSAGPSTVDTRYGRDEHSSKFSYAVPSRASGNRRAKDDPSESSSLFSRSTVATYPISHASSSASTAASSAITFPSSAPTVPSSAINALSSAPTAPSSVTCSLAWSASTAKQQGTSEKVAFRAEIPLMVEVEMTSRGELRLEVKKIGGIGEMKREKERGSRGKEGVDVTSWVGKVAQAASRT